MRVAGIIAEYNPFHNGHAWQLKEVRERTGADYIVIAMGGDFLERGVPAIVDKHTRTEMALRAGADLVLELPAVSSTGSAERFAAGGVGLLAATNVVDVVCYGVETEDPGLLRDAASALAHPAPALDRRIAELVKKGTSYPKAREEALCAELDTYPADELSSFLSSPNNILALEYEKAILRLNEGGGRPVSGLGIRRVGDHYHEADARCIYASATAIRRLLLSPADGQEATDSLPLSLLLPEASFDLLMDAKKRHLLMETNDFSAALFAKLLSEREMGFSQYADCTPALSNRIVRLLPEFVSFSQFAGLLKTKELTLTRINRVLTHILLNIQEEDCAGTDIPCLRVLGFNRRALPLLTEIDKKASAPLLTKVADASQILSETALAALGQDIHAADLYRGISRIKSGQTLGNEYNTPLVIATTP